MKEKNKLSAIDMNLQLFVSHNIIIELTAWYTDHPSLLGLRTPLMYTSHPFHWNSTAQEKREQCYHQVEIHCIQNVIGRNLLACTDPAHCDLICTSKMGTSSSLCSTDIVQNPRDESVVSKLMYFCIQHMIRINLKSYCLTHTPPFNALFLQPSKLHFFTCAPLKSKEIE